MKIQSTHVKSKASNENFETSSLCKSNDDSALNNFDSIMMMQIQANGNVDIKSDDSAESILDASDVSLDEENGLNQVALSSSEKLDRNTKESLLIDDENQIIENIQNIYSNDNNISYLSDIDQDNSLNVKMINDAVSTKNINISLNNSKFDLTNSKTNIDTDGIESDQLYTNNAILKANSQLNHTDEFIPNSSLDINNQNIEVDLLDIDRINNNRKSPVIDNRKAINTTVSNIKGVKESGKEANFSDHLTNNLKEILTSDLNSSVSYGSSVAYKHMSSDTQLVELNGNKIEARNYSLMGNHEIFNENSINSKEPVSIKLSHDISTNTFKLSLHPVELGRIDAKLKFENDHILLDISTSSEKTKDILLNRVNELKQMFSLSDIKIDHIKIENSIKDQNLSSFNENNQYRGSAQEQYQYNYQDRETSNNSITNKNSNTNLIDEYV